MSIYVLQYRTAGEDYQVATFTTHEDAKLAAFNFLLEACGDCIKHDFTTGHYEALVEHCYCDDIAYIEITTHNLPQE